MIRCRLSAGGVLVACLFAFVPSAGAADLGVGFGGYALTDREPVAATTFSFNTAPVLVTASFALRTGEGSTSSLLAAKAIMAMKKTDSTMLGLGASLALPFTSGDDPIGLGLGGGVQTFVSERVALVADLWPISFQFSPGTRVGILSSGAIGVTYYFSEM